LRIAFIVDNPFRDLQGLTLLAMHLCQQGAHCFLVPMYLSSWEIWSIAPDFILCHYLRKNNQAAIQAAIQAGIKTGLLDTEGGVSQAMDAYGQALAPDAGTRYGLSVICSWGPLFAEYAVKKSWYLARQMEITGQPRFDFYAPIWRDAALTLAAAAREVASPFILINSNVFMVNSAFQTPEQDVEMYVKVFGFDRDTVLEWKELERQKMAGMVEMTNDLARTFPEVNFVFRPHPFEKAETYQDLMEPRDNLFIIKKGAVHGWILRALAVIQHGCSTSVEAGMTMVPSLSPRWVKSATSVETSEAVSVPCETREELFSHISRIIEGEYQIPAGVKANIDRIIADRFYRIDGFSHRRVGGAIFRVLQEDPAGVDLDECRRRYWGHDGSFKGWLRMHLRKALGITPDRPVRFWRKNGAQNWQKTDKYFNAAQVNEIVKAMEPAAVKNFPGNWRPVKVDLATEDYLLPHKTGESVVIKPL
jgi:surface carbohydrate biosynthesis protein